MALNRKLLKICLALFCFKNNPKNVFFFFIQLNQEYLTIYRHRAHKCTYFIISNKMFLLYKISLFSKTFILGLFVSEC